MTDSRSSRSLAHHWLSLAVVGIWACGGVSTPDADSLGGGSATGGESAQAGASALGSGGSGTSTQPGSGGTSATGGATVTGGASSTQQCTAPNYSSDCSQVAYFQCGPSVSCDGTTLRVQWHEHVMCARTGQTSPYDTIFSYTCTYPCAKQACELVGGWPSNGSAIAQTCDSSL